MGPDVVGIDDATVISSPIVRRNSLELHTDQLPAPDELSPHGHGVGVREPPGWTEESSHNATLLAGSGRSRRLELEKSDLEGRCAKHNAADSPSAGFRDEEECRYP